MPRLLDNLAEETAAQQKAAEERRRNRADERDRERQFDAAWGNVIRACTFRLPDGPPGKDFFQEAETSFRALGALLVERGWDGYLPAIIATRKEAVARDDLDARPELYVAECLRLACWPATVEGTIAEHLARAAELWPHGIDNQADNVHEFLRIREMHGGELPPERMPPADARTILVRGHWRIKGRCTSQSLVLATMGSARYGYLPQTENGLEKMGRNETRTAGRNLSRRPREGYAQYSR